MSRTTIVTTTIRVPTFLRDVLDNAKRHHHEQIASLVIGDTKTPVETAEFCRSLSAASGISVTYLDIEAQRRALADYPQLWNMMPLNCGARKLLGNFLAYLDGCETLIMLDDDNFVAENDFIGWHGVVGTTVSLPIVTSSSGWYNIAETVVEASGVPFYPRGYPWSQRVPQSARPTVKIHPQPLRVAVKNGLVLEDPDIDAISRLFWPIRVTALRPDFAPQFGLAPGTWTPFNNQNTSLARDLIPVYYTPPSTGRNADIWTSFVICRLVEHMGQAVSFGQPLVRQIRNPHDLWRDLEDETCNNRATDRFVALLRSIPLSAPTYVGALEQLLRGGLAGMSALADVPEDQRNMMQRFFEEYQMWLGLFTNAEVPLQRSR